MKKISILILTLFLVSLTVVCAADFNFEITPIRDEIDAGEDAQFLITIESTSKEIKDFKIYSVDVEWDVPITIIKTYPETDTNEKITISPSKYVEAGKTYGIKLNFKDIDSEEIVHSEIAEINVKSSGEIVSAYRPSIRMVIDAPSNIDPREPVNIKARIENQNLLDLSDLKLRVNSELKAFETEEDVELVPLGKKIVEIDYSLDPLQDPGDYKIIFELVQGTEIIESTSKTVKISSVKPKYLQEGSESSTFFKTTEVITYTSSSNIEDTQTINLPASKIKNWFVSTYPESKVTLENGQKYNSVDLTLRPGESRDITIITNYRILVYLILFIIVIVIVYYRYKSPLGLRKGISDVGIKEGGISELKITLELVNSDKKAVKNVVVTDYVPNIADVQKEFIEGTLKPARVFKHRSKGTVLKWEIEELSPGEVRLISYNMKSKLSIIGNLKMPRAKVGFKKKKREFVSYSNQVGVSS